MKYTLITFQNPLLHGWPTFIFCSFQGIQWKQKIKPLKCGYVFLFFLLTSCHYFEEGAKVMNCNLEGTILYIPKSSLSTKYYSKWDQLVGFNIPKKRDNIIDINGDYDYVSKGRIWCLGFWICTLGVNLFLTCKKFKIII